MGDYKLIDAMMEILEETGLADRPGKLLYSCLGTLRPGRLYLLGYNPGGDPRAETGTVRSHLASLGDTHPNWNEYLDACWRPGGRVYPPGVAPMQQRVQYTLAGLGHDVRAVCASNLVFVRSTGLDTLSERKLLAERCWRLHECIIDTVQPSCIIALGNDVLDFIVTKSVPRSAPESFPSGHGKWACRVINVVLQERDTVIITLPHLSRYAIDHHPDVVEWMHDKLAR